jgi:uncharacterized protein (DUF302 family)
LIVKPVVLTLFVAASVLAGCAAGPGTGLKPRNLAVLARVDHAAGAQRIGQALLPTEVLIFGNPQAGTPLMQCAQGVGIDLPMKALVWADAQGQTRLGYNDPVWLVQRHGGGECPAAANVRQALAAIAAATVAP